MTKADKWKKRPRVLRYRAFADELRLKLDRSYDFNGKEIEFGVQMPKSWPKWKKEEMVGTPHTQVPDLDNFLKALFDAHMGDDSGIHCLNRLTKVWSEVGYIKIEDGIPW